MRDGSLCVLRSSVRSSATSENSTSFWCRLTSSPERVAPTRYTDASVMRTLQGRLILRGGDGDAGWKMDARRSLGLCAVVAERGPGRGQIPTHPEDERSAHQQGSCALPHFASALVRPAAGPRRQAMRLEHDPMQHNQPRDRAGVPWRYHSCPGRRICGICRNWWRSSGGHSSSSNNPTGREQSSHHRESKPPRCKRSESVQWPAGAGAQALLGCGGL